MSRSQRIFIGGKHNKTKGIFIGGKHNKTKRIFIGGKHKKRHHKGGDASDYALGVAGDLSTQTSQTFGPAGGDSNALVVTVDGQNHQLGGRRRKGTRKRTRKSKKSCMSFWGGGAVTPSTTTNTAPAVDTNSLLKTLTGLKGFVTPPNQTHKGGKKQKGGFWGNVLSQATVPLALLGLQQSYRGPSSPSSSPSPFPKRTRKRFRSRRY